MEKMKEIISESSIIIQNRPFQNRFREVHKNNSPEASQRYQKWSRTMQDAVTSGFNRGDAHSIANISVGAHRPKPIRYEDYSGLAANKIRPFVNTIPEIDKLSQAPDSALKEAEQIAKKELSDLMNF